MFNFLWNGKPDKIKRTTLIQTIENGGIKFPDIYYLRNANKASWVPRIMDENNNGLWKTIYQKRLNRHGGNLVFESNLQNEDINTTLIS